MRKKIDNEVILAASLRVFSRYGYRKATLEDIAGLKKLGIDGAIAGKAVYTGTLDLAKAIKEAE